MKLTNNNANNSNGSSSSSSGSSSSKNAIQQNSIFHFNVLTQRLKKPITESVEEEKLTPFQRAGNNEKQVKIKLKYIFARMTNLRTFLYGQNVLKGADVFTESVQISFISRCYTPS
jgi:hypothetical protein